MNQKILMESEQRRRDMERKAASHRQTRARANQQTARQALGEWLISTGESLLDQPEPEWNTHSSMRTS